MSEPLTIRCREHGPLVLPATCRIVDHQGNEFPLPVGKEMIALCRCGQSKNKPFCDGSHKQCGFQAPELAPPKPSPPSPSAHP
jgi:CDGSH-type Zn-finger protein